MSFIEPFSSMTTTAATIGAKAVPLGSASVLGGLRNGRIGIEVQNKDAVNSIFYGDKDVTAATGIEIKKGESKFFPVTSTSKDSIYVIAAANTTVNYAEYFQ